MLRKLEKATREYVTNGQIFTGYSTLDELYQELDSLSEEDWRSLRETISYMQPLPCSFKYARITNQIPTIVKQSLIAGIAVSIVTYYATQNILDAVFAGALSATLGWCFLSERACKKENEKDNLLQRRVDNLLQHDRFFQAPGHFNVKEIRNFASEIDNELNELDATAHKKTA